MQQLTLIIAHTFEDENAIYCKLKLVSNYFLPKILIIYPIFFFYFLSLE